MSNWSQNVTFPSSPPSNNRAAPDASYGRGCKKPDTSCAARLAKNIERLKTAPALRNGSGTPPSNPFNFGPEVLIAAKRIDHARSAVVCAQSVLCHLENGPFLSRCSPQAQPFFGGPVCCTVEYLCSKIFVFLYTDPANGFKRRASQ